MTKKHFRQIWESHFSSFADQELFAICVWVQTMKNKGEWFGYVGNVADEQIRSQAAEEDPQLIEEKRPIH